MYLCYKEYIVELNELVNSNYDVKFMYRNHREKLEFFLVIRLHRLVSDIGKIKKNCGGGGGEKNIQKCM